MPKLPSPENMPRTPEPLSTPKSIGGLAERAGVDVPEEGVPDPDPEKGDLLALRERTEDVTEDIGERDEIEITQPGARDKGDATGIEVGEA